MHTNTQNKDKNGYGSLTALSETLDVGHYYFMYYYFMYFFDITHTLSHKQGLGLVQHRRKNPSFLFI